MQNRIVLSIFALTAGLAFSSVGFGQNEVASPGWKTCPHCLTPKQQRENDAAVLKPGLPFNPRDLSGVWNTRPDRTPVFDPRGGVGGEIVETVHDAFAKDQNSSGIPPKNLPPMTPYGRKLFDATLTDFKAPEGTPVTNSKDPMLKCDPLGWPRWFGYNYGIEFVMLPDRALHFIEWAHTWRTIWTDGRKPWVTDVVKHTLLPNTEIGEYFCVPSDSNYFNERVLRPSNGAK